MISSMKKNVIPTTVGRYFTRFPYEDNRSILIRDHAGSYLVCKTDFDNEKLLRVVADCGGDHALALQVAALIMAREG